MPRKNQEPSMQAKKVWRVARPIVIAVGSVAIVCCVFSFAFHYVMDRFILPTDSNDPSPITVVVERSDSASTIANKLYNACGEGKEGLINNKAVFKVYVDFVGKANKLKEGTYIHSKNMGIGQIVDIICTGNAPRASITLLVPEGYTIESYTATSGRSIVYAMEQAGLAVDTEEFLSLCNDRAAFEQFAFIADIPTNDHRQYLLEGYLFPDTYQIDAAAGAQSVINRMLLRFNEIFTDEYIARAQELGMGVDEVVTLASMIEREAALDEDFPKVSAVFHNRLRGGQRLESCASLQYVHKTNKYEYDATERSVENPFNTYLYEGLPAGPICNPGKRAIEAALWPNEEYIEQDYRYFCNMDLPENRALAFSKTYEEHLANVERYRPYWS